MDETMGGLSHADLGGGAVLIAPLNGRALTTPMFRAPEISLVYLFALLRASTPERVAGAIQDNLRIYRKIRQTGGFRYCYDALPFERAEWEEHFGNRWSEVQSWKDRYDPRHILTPGAGMV